MKEIEKECLQATRETLTGREKIFDGHFLHVWRDSVKTASGLDRTREYIRHPGAAVIAALFDDGTVLLEYQWRQPCEQAFWELPAGKLDADEPPLECAKRELKEETGYSGGNWYYLGRIHNAIGYSNEKLDLFLVRQARAGAAQPDEGECLTVHRVPFNEALEMALDGRITDVKTIIGLLWVEKFLQSKMPDKPMP